MTEYCFDTALNRCCDNANLPKKNRAGVLATLLSINCAEVTPVATRKWLNGTTKPSLNLIPVICKVLDCEPNELFDLNPNKGKIPRTLSTTYYTNPNNPDVISTTHYTFMPWSNTQLYLILIDDTNGALMNVDKLRDQLINQVCGKEALLVRSNQVKVIVSVGQLSRQRARVFDLTENNKGALETNFEHSSNQIDSELLGYALSFLGER